MTYRTTPWRPKDAPNFFRNPCAYCGKEMKTPARFEVHVIDGGGKLLHVDDESLYESDAGEMGLHPIGSGCVKHIPAGFVHKLKVTRP